MTAPLVRLADRLKITEGQLKAIDPIGLVDVQPMLIYRTLDAVRKALFSGIPIISADNISEWYYNGTDKEYWELRDDFPCVIPPFKQFWVEWTKPSQVRSREFGTHKA